MNALIGTGFCANENDFYAKARFFGSLWLPNVGDRDVVVVDNSELPPLKKLNSRGDIRVISVKKNAGHVGSFLGQFRPHLAGWSLSWILPALIAYSESRDIIYQEADCLAFGDWEQSIYADMEQKKLLMAFGEGSKWAGCEQSLFLIKHEFITEAIYKYLAIADGDGLTLPEEKFQIMERNDFRIGRFSLGVGRNRPIDFEAKAFYAQKISAEELEQLRILELIK